MVKEIRKVLARSNDFATDAVGAVSLMVILFAGLHLPALI